MQDLLQEHLQTIDKLQQRIGELRPLSRGGKAHNIVRRIMALEAEVLDLHAQVRDIREYIEVVEEC